MITLLNEHYQMITIIWFISIFDKEMKTNPSNCNYVPVDISGCMSYQYLLFHVTNGPMIQVYQVNSGYLRVDLLIIILLTC